MNNMLDRTDTVGGLKQALAECMDAYDSQGLFVLAEHANGFSPGDLGPILQDLPVPLDYYSRTSVIGVMEI